MGKQGKASQAAKAKAKGKPKDKEGAKGKAAQAAVAEKKAAKDFAKAARWPPGGPREPPRAPASHREPRPWAWAPGPGPRPPGPRRARAPGAWPQAPGPAGASLARARLSSAQSPLGMRSEAKAQSVIRLVVLRLQHVFACRQLRLCSAIARGVRFERRRAGDPHGKFLPQTTGATPGPRGPGQGADGLEPGLGAGARRPGARGPVGGPPGQLGAGDGRGALPTGRGPRLASPARPPPGALCRRPRAPGPRYVLLPLAEGFTKGEGSEFRKREIVERAER